MAQLFPHGGGYAKFLHGRVVDMLYFPIITNAHYPSWIPYFGGKDFEFFEPVFNIADASISTGVIALLVFQNRFLHKTEGHNAVISVRTESIDDNKELN